MIEPFWTANPADDTGCTDAELEEIQALLAREQGGAREARAAFFDLGDWLLEKYGPPESGKRDRNDEKLSALADRKGVDVFTLQKRRQAAYRWSGVHAEARVKVLQHPVFAAQAVMLAAVRVDGHKDLVDISMCEPKINWLLRVLDIAHSAGRREITEAHFLRSLGKEVRPSHQPGVQNAKRVVNRAVKQYAERPEVRAAVLESVKADEEARRAVVAAYVLDRPALAQAVIREDPELAQVASEEFAARQDNGTPASDGPNYETRALLQEIVEGLGGGKPSPATELAGWQNDFVQAITRVRTLVESSYPAQVVIAKSDHDLIDVIESVAEDFNTWVQAITESRKPGLRVVGR
ncbi:hypothetical protein AB0953_02700 [Streptomyces sp. NPDC046866]|uniref:hypothetical protein n=1 Tax=Streptomyces sp. NPDC046866 TaxID=3154921 RepID=UPI003453DD1C